MEITGSSFRVFSNLPREMQDEIFNQAITNRHCRGFVQSFWLINNRLLRDEDAENRSGYLDQDAQLWLSCEQARDAIKRHWSLVTKSKKQQLDIMKVATVSGHQTVVIHPEKDMFLMRIPSSRLPQFDLTELASHLMKVWKTTIPPRLGLLFNTDWYIQLFDLYSRPPIDHVNELPRKKVPVARLIDAVCRGRDNHLWYIVDHNLVPRSNMPETEIVSKGNIYLGSGCRYINVKADDIGQTWEARDGKDRVTAPFFVQDLHNFIFESFWEDKTWNDYQESAIYQSLGVLACLPDDHFQAPEQ